MLTNHLSLVRSLANCVGETDGPRYEKRKAGLINSLSLQKAVINRRWTCEGIDELMDELKMRVV